MRLRQHRPVLTGLVGVLAWTVEVPGSHAQVTNAAITVSIRVTDRRSDPVADLTADDVEVAVDGQPLGAGRVAVEAAPPGGRRLVFVVHQPSLGPEDAALAVEVLRTLARALPATDRLAVWGLPAKAAQLLFTVERMPIGIQLGRMRGARAQAGRHALTPGQAAAITAGDATVLDRLVERECGGGPVPGGERSGADQRAGGETRPGAPTDAPAGTDRARCREEIAREAGALVERARADGADLLRALGPLVETLARLDGVKHLVLLSGPLGAMDRALEAGARAIALEAASGRTVVHAVEVARGASEASRPGAAGLEGEGPGLLLARETGGVGVAGGAARTAGERLARALQHEAALTLALGPAERDGAPHDLRVRVTRPGTFRVDAPRRFRAGTAIGPAAPAPASPAPASPGAAPPAAGFPPSVAPSQPAAALPAEEPGAIPGTVSVAPLAPAPSPAVGAAPASTPPGPSLQVLIARAGAYVALYSRVMPSAVLEEHYVQLGKLRYVPPTAPDEAGLAWRDDDPTGGLDVTIRERRQTRSDVMLVRLPDGGSTAFRDVFEANGRQLRGRDERLRKLFLEGSADSARQMRRIHETSADWNLGSFYREVNVPDLGLSVFDPRHAGRFTFELGTVAPDVDGRPPCRDVRFLEVGRPTLVRSTDRRNPNVPLRGAACVDETGRIWRTRLDLDEHYTARGLIEVTFAPADRVPVLVPDRMWEWYRTSASTFAPRQFDHVEALARYSNLRLFSVTTTEEVK